MRSFLGSRFNVPGGSSATDPGVAYILSNGDNASAQIGDPAKPFLTAQAAFDAGARSFYVGSGVTSSITISSSGAKIYSLFFTGAVIHTSTMSVSVTSTDSSVDVRIRSDFSVQFDEVFVSATTSTCNLELVGLFATTVEAVASGDPTVKILFCEVGTDNSSTSGANLTLSTLGGVAYLNPV